MTVLNVSNPADRSSLTALLQSPDQWFVACLCAAWCKSCEGYRETFTALSGHFPTWAFAWVDIEDEAELVGDHDVENFPTLLVQHGDAVLFVGALTPQPGVAQRLLASLAEGTPPPVDAGFDLRSRLLAGA